MPNNDISPEMKEKFESLLREMPPETLATLVLNVLQSASTSYVNQSNTYTTLAQHEFARYPTLKEMAQQLQTLGAPGQTQDKDNTPKSR